MGALLNNVIGQKLCCAGFELQCPQCGADLHELTCSSCLFRIQMIDGIYHALPADRMAHYAQFMRDYERIRSAEGRGSEKEEFYLNLPYRDASGNNSAQWKIRARSYDYFLRRLLPQVCPQGQARILDLGAGNCWMSFRLSLAGHRPVAVDLLTNDRDGLGAARHYRQHLEEPFPCFQAEMIHLPFGDGQFDIAVFNSSFHYCEDGEQAMDEALRCVRIGGMVIVVDTPWYSREESGRQMVAERRAFFLRKYGTASDSIASFEYLTGERLRRLGHALAIHWDVYRPHYGLKWAIRPVWARIRGRREPSRFRIYATRKTA